MTTLTIRKLDERLKARLRLRAAQHKRSMEEEARTILKLALEQDESGANFAQSIRKLFSGVGPLEIPDLRREPVPKPRFGR